MTTMDDATKRRLGVPDEATAASWAKVVDKARQVFDVQRPSVNVDSAIHKAARAKCELAQAEAALQLFIKQRDKAASAFEDAKNDLNGYVTNAVNELARAREKIKEDAS